MHDEAIFKIDFSEYVQSCIKDKETCVLLHIIMQ